MDQTQISIDLNDLKSNGIIHFLPGIFYVYQLSGKDFELIHWNVNHERVTGYSASELKGKRVFDFFYPADFEVISKGLSEILMHGQVKQVYANLRLKDGRTLPYLFEGYKFESGDTIYFLGVGLDISSYERARRELDHVKFELERKNKELLGFSLKNVQLSALKKEISQSFERLRSIDSLEELGVEISNIEKKLHVEAKKQDMWELFHLGFKEVHQDFFDNLRSKHPTLSKTELRYLAYLKIKLSDFQIAVILNVGKDAIKKKRYRIRKKMGIPASPPLEDYMEQF